MEQLKKLLNEKNSKNRKQSTLEQVENNIRRLYNRCYGENPEDISQIAAMIQDVSHTFACLQSNWDSKKLSYSSMLAYTNSLIVVNDLLGLNMRETYLDLERELQVRRADFNRKNPIKTTKINRLDLDRISADLDGKNLKNQILFSIISQYPFRCETATLKLISRADYDMIGEKPKINYLIDELDTGGAPGGNTFTFAFNAYKTDKRYGTREIQITDEKLNDMISEYTDSMDYDDFIFWDAPDDSEKSQNKQRNNLSVWTRRLLKKYKLDASITDVTKYLITEIWDSGSVQDKIRFAEFRGHDIQTAAKVYATSL